MCGIFGYIENTQKQNLEACFQAISHRGPDDFGLYQEESLSLIHYRLAIQDLSSAGHQPMWSTDGRYCILLNGEIYNHWELRQELQINYTFKSHSDAETMLYSFVKWHVNSFKLLNGIFAAVIFDKQEQELYIVRDPLGVKPFYYLDDPVGFAFCSELKALAKLEGWNRALDVYALFNYLSFLYSPGSQTPFKHIKKLEPGHFIHYSVRNKQILTCNKYFEISFNGRYRACSEAECLDLLDVALQRAVKRQLISDVPIGYFVSGGLDSALLLAIVRKLNPTSHIKGFTIQTRLNSKLDGFADDLPYALKLAKILDIDLEVIDGDFNFPDVFPDLVYQLDEPQADLAPFYIAAISQSAKKQNYPVLIGGTGGDDLFSGYRRHKSYQIDKLLLRIPFFFRRILFLMSFCIPGHNPTWRRIKKFLAKYRYRNPKRVLAENFCWMDKNQLLKLFHPETQALLKDYDPAQILLDSLENIPEEHHGLNQMLYWEQKYFLSDHNLNYSDKASMLHGVELRVPYLDLELLALCNQIHPDLKLKNGIPKYLLKKLAERYLPNEIIYRPKTGFGVPLRYWITEKYPNTVANTFKFSDDKFRKIFDIVQIQEWLQKNANYKMDASYTILELMAIQYWLRSMNVSGKSFG